MKTTPESADGAAAARCGIAGRGPRLRLRATKSYLLRARFASSSYSLAVRAVQCELRTRGFERKHPTLLHAGVDWCLTAGRYGRHQQAVASAAVLQPRGEGLRQSRQSDACPPSARLAHASPWWPRRPYLRVSPASPCRSPQHLSSSSWPRHRPASWRWVAGGCTAPPRRPATGG